MKNQIGYFFQVASTLSVLLPLGFGLWRFKRNDFSMKWFVFFLSVGFLTDMTGWYFYMTGNDTANLRVQYFYDLFETLFLFWFLGQVSQAGLAKFLLARAWMVVVPFWAVRFFYVEARSIFRTLTEICIAFTACFIILRLIEINSQVTKQLIFWILLGIFFYCFSTYIIMGILAIRLSKFWFAHDLLNIATNLIYLVGFLKSQPQVKSISTISNS